MDDVKEFFGIGGGASNGVGGPSSHDTLIGYQPPGTVVGEEGDAGRDCVCWVWIDAEGLQSAGELLDLLVEVGIGEFNFRCRVGIVEGDGLGKSLFDDRPNFRYRSNATIVDRAAEVGEFNVAHLGGGARCGVVHRVFSGVLKDKVIGYKFNIRVILDLRGSVVTVCQPAVVYLEN